MKRIINSVIVPLILILWGCSTNTTEPSQTVSDEQAILELLQEMESSDTADYFYADLDELDENEFISDDEQVLQKPVIPLKFGRVGLRPIVKDVRIEFTSDTSATVYFKKIMRGKFLVVTLDSAFNIVRIPKKLGHEFNRIAYFVKLRNQNEDLKHGWRLKKFSMVSGESLGIVDTNLVKTSLEITKLEITTDTTIIIEDPLSYFQKRHDMFTFLPGTEVKVTVHVKNNSQKTLQVPAGKGTELVRIHFGRHRRWRDTRLEKHGIRILKWMREENGENVYQGSWITTDRFRVHHAVIDVIDNGTIFDDDRNAYPYNSVTWSTPYKIKPVK
jgi:hypothetical protein